MFVGSGTLRSGPIKYEDNEGISTVLCRCGLKISFTFPPRVPIKSSLYSQNYQADIYRFPKIHSVLCSSLFPRPHCGCRPRPRSRPPPPPRPRCRHSLCSHPCRDTQLRSTAVFLAFSGDLSAFFLPQNRFNYDL